MSIRLIDRVWSLDLKNEGEYLVLLALADSRTGELWVFPLPGWVRHIL
jgi:hypothetical protein